VFKVIVNSIFSELRIYILSVSIYYGTQSDIRVKSYCRFNFLRASSLNFECPDILPDSIGHHRKKLLSFELPTSFRFQFRPFRYITGLIQTSVYKVIVNSIFSELRIKILSVSTYYWTQSDIRVKSYCRFNLIRASVFNL